MPLVHANVGEKQIIKKLEVNQETKKHMADLGFNVGGEVSIVLKLKGNMILSVKESRVAISEELARQIMV